jgi:LysR family transcriptional activator of nhaA
MTTLNYKHLKYFWMVAKTGSIAQASKQLHLTPQSISGQLSQFEHALGVTVLKRVGRRLELTDAGRRIASYAEDIFALGDELLDAVRDQEAHKTPVFRVGFADSISKLMAYQLVEPALRLEPRVQLVCREGGMATLLADLSVHRLDLIIADRPMPAHYNVRGFSHRLGGSSLTAFASRRLAARLKGAFPQLLDSAPFLMPGRDTAIYPLLVRWLDDRGLRPQVIGEFDDGALMQAFGQAGAGVFFAPTAIADSICRQYQVQPLGHIEEVIEQTYAISTERRLTHPAVVAISAAARSDVFGSGAANHG